MELDTLCRVVKDAHEMGYEVLSVSGGEPLLYRHLDEVLAVAKSLGMGTTITTNGTLLDRERCERLRGLVDICAISLDGPPDLHNEIRNSSQAFDRLLSGLRSIKAVGVPFGVIHTLTRRSWDHLLWIAEFAAAQGSSLLQIHPLELIGRAASEMAVDSPDDDVLCRTYLLSLALLAKYGNSMRIQLDVIDRESLLSLPEVAAPLDSTVDPTLIPAADLVNPLVVEPLGRVVPVSYGFSREYQICDLRHQTLKEAWLGFLRKGYPQYRDLCNHVLAEHVKGSNRQLFSWYELLVKHSVEGNWGEPLEDWQRPVEVSGV